MGGLIRECVKLLTDGGNNNPRFEAEQLVMAVCGADRKDLLTDPERAVNAAQLAELEGFVSRRLSGEPLQYILGEWEFYGLPFCVGEGVLIPRQDTEIIAEVALDYAKKHEKPDFLAADLCAGSGCIGITLAKLAGVRVKLLELSDQALVYLRRNIVLNGVDCLCESVHADVLSEKTAEDLPQLDLIVTNPPYLTAKDMRELQTEVGFEPETALYGGEDGLDYYRRIIPLWSGKLRPGGMLAAEIGMGQEREVMKLFEQSGIMAQSEKDLCGIIRVIYGIKNGG
ncbi:MAG: peptide chain release factor N(5)-glutamine methyltransferase [Oscillospiraceae bacterium]|nr:peptide chain release factor N(5)-glutamine methyltransferase [Oscillospiraceae bacterium]